MKPNIGYINFSLYLCPSSNSKLWLSHLLFFLSFFFGLSSQPDFLAIGGAWTRGSWFKRNVKLIGQFSRIRPDIMLSLWIYYWCKHMDLRIYNSVLLVTHYVYTIATIKDELFIYFYLGFCPVIYFRIVEERSIMLVCSILLNFNDSLILFLKEQEHRARLNI